MFCAQSMTWKKIHLHSIDDKLSRVILFLASCDFHRLLITFTNRFDPDQNVGPDMDSNHLTLRCYFRKNVFEKIN